MPPHVEHNNCEGDVPEEQGNGGDDTVEGQSLVVQFQGAGRWPVLECFLGWLQVTGYILGCILIGRCSYCYCLLEYWKFQVPSPLAQVFVLFSMVLIVRLQLLLAL
ncbi:Hypothetical predicted protein [Olea europaea subsp. europaea]|uniref:Uncharacterized protein n=1 Tax=Olea europaea subsp. europaea TaxID=158383 RepID=A0A8S0RC82_OLEEU|nr:Hypothetical predicted protein [Olea europaea subsp. europaea]